MLRRTFNKLVCAVPLFGGWKMRPVKPSEDSLETSGEAVVSDGLKSFRPLPGQEAFFKSRSQSIFLGGDMRSGKTTCAAARMASLARDVPVTLESGTRVDCSKPWQREGPLTLWAIASNECLLGHILKNILRFIPHREIRDWQWQDKQNFVPRTIRLRNGNIICFSRTLRLPAGESFDYAWIDCVPSPAGITFEILCRLFDRKGTLVISSSLRGSSREVYRLIQWASSDHTEVHILSLTENKHLGSFSRESASACV